MVNQGVKGVIYAAVGGNILLYPFAGALDSAFIIRLAGIWTQLRKI